MLNKSQNNANSRFDFDIGSYNQGHSFKLDKAFIVIIENR